MASNLTAKQWIERIRNGQRFQVKFAQMRAWNDYKDYYRHKFAAGTLPVNLVFSIMQSMISQTYIKNPSVTINPTKPGLKSFLQSKVRESVARYLIRERRTKDELKCVIRDNFLCGIGYIVHGYDSEYGWSPKMATPEMPATLTQFNKKGYRLEYNSYINPGMPWAIRPRPDDIVWPWGLDRANNAEWYAMRKIRPLKDMKQDKKYKIPSEIQGTILQRRTGVEGMSQQEELPGYTKDYEKLEEYIEFWEIHDAKTGKVFAVIDGCDELIRQDEDAMQIDGLPIISRSFNEDPDYIYGIPDARIIEPQLLELIEIRTQAMKHRRVDLLKMLVKKGAISPDAINKLLDEDVKAIVEVNDIEGPLGDSVLPMSGSIGGILNDMMSSAESVRQDVREMVGFSRVQTGEFQGKTHVTKAEVTNVAASSDIRLDERRDQLADMLVDIVRKDLQIIDTYWTIPQVVDIIGPDGAKYWIKYTGPEIKGEYNYEIDPNSDDVITPQARRQEAVEMAKAWTEMNMGKVKAGAPVPAEIQRYFFSQYKGVNVEKLLAEQGVPQNVGGPDNPMSMDEAAMQMKQRMAQQQGMM